MKTYHFNKILVPTDLSELTQPALKYVLFLAEPALSRVEVLHVISTESEEIKDEIPNSDENVAKEKARNLSKKNLGGAIQPVVRTKIGFVNDLIIETAINSMTNLIVMGYYNDLDGSTMSERILDIIYKSPCPVLAVQPDMTEPKYKNIIVPLRDREGMVDKMEYVVSFAKNFDSKIHLIPFYTNAKTPIARKRMNELVECIHSMLEENGIDYSSTKVISGKYVHKTLEIAEKEGGDLIVIMAEQSGSFQKLFGNADEENFLRLSGFPILTTPLEQPLQTLPNPKETRLKIPSYLTIVSGEI